MSLTVAIACTVLTLACVLALPSSKGQQHQEDIGIGLRRELFVHLPEENMNTSQMISFHGYPVEEHTVITEDGYILSLQRIPGGRLGVKPNGEVALLQHGLIASSTNFVTNSNEDSLGFVLADLGYDVWLGNSRGNTYSNRHIKYTIHDDEFWDFSFDEMAKYDFPAMIDYILSVTHQTQLHYVGHSQGTTIPFAALSNNQTLGKKIKVLVAMAPVASLKEVKGAIRVTSYFTPELKFLFKLFGIQEFFPSAWYIKLLAQDLCALHPGEFVCANFVFLLAGFDMCNLNKTRLPVYISHTPAGTSVKDMIHWAQMARTDNFMMYDYGREGNVEHYNKTSPPSYDVSNIQVPVAIFSGSNDWLADPYDVNQLVHKLPNLVFNKAIEGWNHLDFIWGENAGTTIYKDVVELLEKYK